MKNDRVINTTQSLSDPNVNSQGQIDEDGEYDGETNKGGDADEEEDTTPAVHSATVVHNGQHTDINVRVATATGYQNKRHVLPGHLTAKRLADAIRNVASW